MYRYFTYLKQNMAVVVAVLLAHQVVAEEVHDFASMGLGVVGPNVGR